LTPYRPEQDELKRDFKPAPAVELVRQAIRKAGGDPETKGRSTRKWGSKR